MKVVADGIFLGQRNETKSISSHVFFPKRFFHEFHFTEEVNVVIPKLIKQNLRVFGEMKIQIEKKRFMAECRSICLS